MIEKHTKDTDAVQAIAFRQYATWTLLMTVILVQMWTADVLTLVELREVFSLLITLSVALFIMAEIRENAWAVRWGREYVRGVRGGS